MKKQAIKIGIWGIGRAGWGMHINNELKLHKDEFQVTAVCDILPERLEELKKRYPEVDFFCYQSNVEGEMINKIHEVGFEFDGIVLNAGAYTHTSIALQDAIRAVNTPVVEVHISNVHQREEFRHKSMISCACVGVICGFGLDSYRLAVEALLARHEDAR